MSNHGFLLTPRGWTLVPAYDMNSTLSEYQSLLINSSTNEILLESCEEYMISKEEARQIIDHVIKGVSKWKTIAVSLGIGKHEIDMFEQVYSKTL